MRARLAVVVFVVFAGGVARAQTQDIGHKTPGTIGLNAGTMQDTGLYALYAIGAYRSDRVVDRSGATLPLDLDASAFVSVFGVSGSYELPRLHTWIGATFTAPVARVSISIDDPRTSLDRFGFGDIYVEPLQLGWRPPRSNVVVSYGFYAPTGRFEPGGARGIGAGQWTHQLSTGGTVWFDHARRWKLSALFSYEHNERKLNVDIQRGDSVSLEGGAGVHFARVLDGGVAGYADWQITDDRGSALPPVVAGARSVAYGLGPEIDVTVPSLRSTITMRYTHDVAARSRPFGSLVFVAIGVSVWGAR